MTDEHTENGMLFDDAVSLARDIEAAALWNVQRIYRQPHPDDDAHLWHIVAAFEPDSGSRGKWTYIHNPTQWGYHRERAASWVATHPKGRRRRYEQRTEADKGEG